MASKKTTTAAPAADQTEAVALSRIPAFQPIELEIVRDILGGLALLPRGGVVRVFDRGDRLGGVAPLGECRLECRRAQGVGLGGRLLLGGLL